jgi:hypothetical protein
LGAVVAAVFVVGLLLLAGSARAGDPPALTHPRWVADSPATGTWIKTWTQGSDTATYFAGDDEPKTISGVRAIECVANTETKFTAYWFRRGLAVQKVKWPLYGVAATDTTYTVPAGETRTYHFDKPYVQFIIIKSGDADFSGE